jgi:hypothetical protein
MSGGEQQMLAIGRGLMAEPKLLILDEPSLGLSPLLVEELFGADRPLHADGPGGAAGRAERRPVAGDRRSAPTCWRTAACASAARPPSCWPATRCAGLPGTVEGTPCNDDTPCTPWPRHRRQRSRWRRADARPIRLWVGVTPGGSTDTLAREIAPEMGRLLGRTVIVENRSGAGGNLAADFVAKSRARWQQPAGLVHQPHHQRVAVQEAALRPGGRLHAADDAEHLHLGAGGATPSSPTRPWPS